MAYNLNQNDETNHINTATVDFIKPIRKEFSGLYKVYGIRYIEALAKICKYTVTDSGKTLIIAGCQRKEFKSNRDAGRFMELTIQDLIGFGIL